MARLGSYFGLCPLVDQQNLLGISEASESGHVIVTLSKNIVVKYRISDQKQVQSWRTKDKLSSPVIFDWNSNKYAGAFNSNNLKIWTEEDEHLDKLKKYKFNESIYTLLDVKRRSFVVFKNGNIFPLDKCIENRKELSFAKIFETESELIEDVLSIADDDVVYFGLISADGNKKLLYINVIQNEDHQQVLSKINLTRKDTNLSGYVLCQMYNKSIQFLSFWSDHKFYSLEINNIPETTESCGEMYAPTQSVSSSQFVAITAINNDSIAIYGADPNQEGAKLIIYNTQFKLSQSILSFKLFSKAKKIWHIENFLFMCSGQNLAVVPFSIDTERLAAIVGSHKIDLTDNDVQQNFCITNWNSEKEIDTEINYQIPEVMKDKVKDLLTQGLSEVAICDHLILLFIENNEINCINECLDYFKDISEKSIVNLLVYFLEKELVAGPNFSSQHFKMIDKLLYIPVSEALIMPHLKREFNVNVTLCLIQYITNLLSSDGPNLPSLDSVQYERKLIDWGCMLLDANYQKLLLTSDDIVSEILKSFKGLVKEYLECMKDIKDVIPLCENIVKRRVVTSTNYFNSKCYIKEIKLF